MIEEKAENEGKYLAYEFESPLFGFVDDVEFLIRDKEGVVDFRSASRVGQSDLGKNGKRIGGLVEMLKERYGWKNKGELK